MPKQDSKKKTSTAVAKKSLFVLLHFLKWTLIVGIIGCFLVGGIAIGYFTSLVKGDSVRSKDFIMQKIQENETTGFVYFSDNTAVGQLRSDEDRRLVAINDIPQVVKDAFIATEDRNFYQHYGIDLSGFFRAVKQKLLHEPVQTGGSTITQQLARRVFLNLDQTDTRKAKEILLALRLERFLSKDEILQAYLNKIPFGNGSNGYNVYGIKAAAEGIFNLKDLNQLNLAQAAFLAGLPKNPNDYSAFTGKGSFDPAGFNKALVRQHTVLKSMLVDNKITQDQYEQALHFDLKGSLAQTKPKAYTTYPYLMIEAEQRAAKLLLKLKNPKLTEQDLRSSEYTQLIQDASEQMRRNGYKIYTTIDKPLYDAMQTIAKNPDNFPKDDKEKGMVQVGSMIIDNHSGAILGMIEGRDFYKEQMNHATQAERQPGSSMKPLAAYAPAIEMGAIQPATPIDDVPIILPDGSKGYHVPVNWDYKYHGMVSARHALDQSYNIPAIKLFNDVVGVDKAWGYVQKMGITTLDKRDFQAKTGVIGGLTYGVTVEEMTNAYTTFGNKGMFNDAFMIRKIEDSEGNVLYEHQPRPVQVFSEDTTFLIDDMMRTVIANGTAYDLKKKFKYYDKIPVVGKTGSTQDNNDIYFEGLSPDVTVGVWTGYDQPGPMKYGNSAKDIWALVMNKAVELRPDLFITKEFPKPDDIIKMTVSNVSGKLPSDLDRSTNHLITDWFSKKDIPTQEDDALMQMKVIPFNHINYTAQPNTPADMTENKIVFKRPDSMKDTLDQLKAIFDKNPKLIPYKRGGRMNFPQDFYPQDMDQSAPAEVDPRVDDGAVPPAPEEVALENLGGVAKITFKPDAEGDVVGYRLYRSLNSGPFRKVDTVIHTGEEPKFVNYISSSNLYAYYVTAVDVAGNESPASQLVFSDNKASGPVLWPPVNSGGQSSGDGTNNGGIQQQSAAPSSPNKLTVKERTGGIGVELNWNKNPDNEKVTQYNIYYSSKQNGEFSNIGSTQNNRFDYINLPADGWYRVTAVNSSGESQPSPAVEFKTVVP